MVYTTTNIATTGVAGSAYEKIAKLQLFEASKLQVAISPENEKTIVGVGNAATFKTKSGLALSAWDNANANGLTYSAGTDAAVPCTASPMLLNQASDIFARAGGVYDVLDEHLQGSVLAIGEAIDSLIATALVGGTNKVRINARATDADIVAGDIITLAAVRQAVAQLRAAKAPQFLVPGFGPLFIGVMNPLVEYDFLREANGALVGNTVAMSQEWKLHVAGIVGGVMWVTSNATALVGTDDGYASVDIQKTPIFGADALCRVHVQFPAEEGKTDVAANVERSAIVRVCDTDIKKTVHACLYQGVARLNNASIRVINSSSSIGANA